MKTPIDDIDAAVAAVEAHEGQEIPGLREGLLQAKNGQINHVHTVEQILIRTARTSAGLSQSVFAELINTPVRTLQEWEQGRATPPGAAIKLCELVLSNPKILAA